MSAFADTIRVATFNPELSRKGPGLLVRDLMRGGADDIQNALARIVEARPDILVLQSIDYDAQGIALGLFQEALKTEGLDLPYSFASKPNAGQVTGFDLNRNGYLGDAADKQSYGLFTGQGGMAVISRYRIMPEAVQDFSDFLWRDLPGAVFPMTTEGAYFQLEELAVLRLHSVSAWDVPVETPLGIVRLLASHANAPVFDGPEDRNGLRNAAELQFWEKYLAGWRPDGAAAHSSPFVLLGDFNNDPVGGEGLKPAITALLNHRAIQDPLAEIGPTVVWDFAGGPGVLRVDYVLPSRDLRVSDAGIGPMGGAGKPGSRHALVWVDIAASP